MNNETIQKQSFFSKINLIIFIKTIVIIALSIFIGSILYYFSISLLIINSLSTLSIFLIQFILALVLKVNYFNKLFILNLIISVILVSFYPFGQGLIIVFILLLGQKLFKLF